MIITLSMIILTAFLNACVFLGSGDFYEADPIRFACITADSQREFYIAKVYGSIPLDLFKRLDNGKGLSLLFHGITNIVDSSFGLLRSFANEWFKASGNNICIVSYAYTVNSSKSSKNAIVNEMVKSGRYENVAKMARDLVCDRRKKSFALSKGSQCLKNLSKVDVSGFGFGAHIAGRTCEYLRQLTGKKVRLLLALDPIKTSAKINDSIKKDYSDYVQVIHTSKEEGIWDKLGDVDVYVNYERGKNIGPLNDEHGIAFFIHVATSTKRLFIAADLSGKGKVIQRHLPFAPMPHPIQCEVGVYGTAKSYHRGRKFILSLKESDLTFWGGLGSFATANIFEGSQDEENSDTDDLCNICCDSKKNAILLPCMHGDTCVSCFNEIKSRAFYSEDIKCPICKRRVYDIKELDI